MRGFVRGLNRRHKPISHSRHRLDIARLFRGVAQPLTQSIHRDIETMVELDESTVWPKPATQFFSTPQAARLLEQTKQNLQRLSLETYLASGFAEFPCLDIQLETRKTHGG